MITYKKPNSQTAHVSIYEYVYLDDKKVGAIKSDLRGYYYKPTTGEASKERFSVITALKNALETE